MRRLAGPRCLSCAHAHEGVACRALVRPGVAEPSPCRCPGFVPRPTHAEVLAALAARWGWSPETIARVGARHGGVA